MRLPSNVHPLGKFVGVQYSWGFFLMVPAEKLGLDDVEALAEILRIQDCFNCENQLQDGQLCQMLEEITKTLGGDSDLAIQLAIEQKEQLGPPWQWSSADTTAVEYLLERCVGCEDCCAPLRRAAERAGIVTRIVRGGED